MASPIGSRSSERPRTSCSSLSIASANWSPSSESVFNVVLSSSMSCSITWLLSANAFENDDVLENSDSMVPPWPCNICSSDAESALTSCGLRPWMTGFSPPSSRSRSSAGAVRSIGYLSARRQDLRRSGSVDEFEVAVPHQVQILDLSLGAVGQLDVASGVELHQHIAVGIQAHVLHGAHPDACDAHRVARSPVAMRP